MKNEISKQTRNELIHAIEQRYSKATKQEKIRILDEFVSLTGFHRKHAIRLLKKKDPSLPAPVVMGRRIYDEAVKETLIVLWEASDRICGKRLKAILPQLILSMERHGHLALDEVVREHLLQISPSTIDRLLAPIRKTAKKPSKRRKRRSASKQIPIKTSSDWHEPQPGFLGIDFVAHCGGSMAGAFIHTLAATDICSEWVEAVPLLAREQSLVVEGLDIICKQIPIPVIGLHSDNDSAFINDTLLDYCRKKKIEFTRSRARRKNDAAWIEQKNGAVIRRFVGYERFSGFVPGQILADLYYHMRLYVNYFQPSFKLCDKFREGSKTKKIYLKPATPHSRLLENSVVDERIKEFLKQEQLKLDPIHLLQQIREAQAALAALSCPQSASGLDHKTLDQFLSQLKRIWKDGEVRATHRTAPPKPHDWRTREDPFKNVWPEVLVWLQEQPDVTAKLLFERLCEKYPDQFIDGQLRTLQRRIKKWRYHMAKKIVYGCLNLNSRNDMQDPVCAEP